MMTPMMPYRAKVDDERCLPRELVATYLDDERDRSEKLASVEVDILYRQELRQVGGRGYVETQEGRHSLGHSLLCGTGSSNRAKTLTCFPAPERSDDLKRAGLTSGE